MRLHLALAALPLLLSAQLAVAADDRPKVDFDQGPNASALLKEAREKSGVAEVRTLREFREIAPSGNLSKISVPPSLKLAVKAPPPSESPTAACEAYAPELDGQPAGLLSACPESETAKSCPENSTVRDLLPKFLRDLAVAPGTIFGGPFGPMPRAGAMYREGLGLKNQVQTAPSIPADTRGALLKDWSEIESIGTGLTNDGNGIDVDDGALYTDAVRINVWADRINNRLAILRRLAGEYNQRCRSGPLPPGEVAACNRWADRFNGCVDRHNAAVGRYEQAVAAWNANYDKLEPRVSDFRVRLQNWADLRIKPFIVLATKALTGGCRKATSLTIVAPPSKVGTTSPGGESVHYVANATYESKPEGSPVCDLVWSLDNVLLGTLSPQTGSASVFKPNRIRGSGVIKVAEKISGLSDTGSIIVQGGRECIKTGEIRTPPAGPNDPFKVTCTYTCPFTGPQVLFLSDPRGYPNCPTVYEP